MDPSFKPFDFHHIFIGEAPLLVLLEIIFRTFIMYLYTIALLRFLGKRGMGQLSMLELAIIVSFGSAVGDPMLGAEPILHGLIAITTVAFIQLGMEKLINSHRKVENVLEGEPACLVDMGLIDLQELKRENLSQADLFRALRENSIEQLGEVDKAFFETSGEITVMKLHGDKVLQGLTIMPDKFVPAYKYITAPATVQVPSTYCCVNCGYREELTPPQSITNCKLCSCPKWYKSV